MGSPLSPLPSEIIVSKFEEKLSEGDNKCIKYIKTLE